MRDKQLFLQMYRNHQMFSNSMEKMCNRYNINHIQLYILLLSMEEKTTVTTLAQELKTSRSAISQAILCLLMKRLIIKEFLPDNKKVFYIVPTPFAIKILQKLKNECDETYKLLYEIVGEYDMRELERLFIKLNDAFHTIKTIKEKEVC